MTDIGTNMKDGFVQMLQVTDSQGYKQLYVAADWLDNVRVSVSNQSVLIPFASFSLPDDSQIRYYDKLISNLEAVASFPYKVVVCSLYNNFYN